MTAKKLSIGGQAVIEGVMIRGASHYAAAVRKNKKIIIREGDIKQKKYRFLKLPVFRGFVNLAEMMVIGIKSLAWSAEQAAQADGREEKLGKSEIILTILASIGFAVLFFIALPYLLTSIIGFTEEASPISFNIIDGIIRILIFLGYIFALSFMKDVRILFQYHGAEHKAIHCYESGKKLNMKNVKQFTTLHPRCGTSFLIIVFIVSIAVFSLLPSLFKLYFPGFLGLGTAIRKAIMLPARIMLIPVIAGISYEALKLSDKYQKSLFFKIISMPGMALQKLTTQEPNDKQIEVAIAALKRLLQLEKSHCY